MNNKELDFKTGAFSEAVKEKQRSINLDRECNNVA